MQDVRDSAQSSDASVIPPTESYAKSRTTVSASGKREEQESCGSNGVESRAGISEEQEDELAVIHEIALSRVRNQAQVGGL